MKRTYTEIRRMIELSLLQTRTARGIVRKAVGRTEAPQTTVPFGAAMDLAGQYASADGTPQGIMLTYNGTSEQTFPLQTEAMTRFADFRGFVYARVLLTVTQAAASGMRLFIACEQLDSDGSNYQISFSPSAPSVPLDETGLHISDWKLIEWVPITDDELRAQFTWLVENPNNATGTYGAGLGQLQLKGE